MRVVERLGEGERGSVWRCAACTVAWVPRVKIVAKRIGTTCVGWWCRLDHNEWIPLEGMPSGPFYEIENPNFDDYRRTTNKEIPRA